MTPSPDGERPPANDEGSLDPRDRDRDERLTGTGERSSAEAALRYASLGWHVFPLQPGRKEPIRVKGELEHGHLDATTDADVIAAWWARWPSANIGVALKASGLAVLDVDPRNGGDVGRLWEACDLGAPLVQSTGGGGWHHLYGDRGVELRSSLGYAGLDGIDVKRDGYIVVAPSVTTGPYEWAEWPEWETVGVEPMPSMVLDLCRAPARAQRSFVTANERPLDAREQAYIDAAVNDACQRLASTPEGYRHSAVYYTARALGEYVGGGVLALDRARTRIVQAAEALYGESLWNVELKTIEQGLTKGVREPRGVPDEYDGARRLLTRLIEADDPMAIAELYAENNPELIRQFGHCDDELELATKNVYAVGGADALARFTLIVMSA